MIPLIYIVGIIIVVLISIGVLCAIAWYRIVKPSEAHMVVCRSQKIVYSSDDSIATQGVGATYFAIPNWIPFFGKVIRIMDLTIKEIVVEQETYEKNQARYQVRSSTKFRIKDVRKAAETFVTDVELQKQLVEVIKASVRAVTVKYEVVDARAKKQEMADAVRKEMEDDLNRWGLNLESFQLVDFQDTQDSTIISDISKRREVAIKSATREENAEKIKQARIKEAEAEEKAKEREIAKDRVIGEKEENKKQKIAEQQKLAEEKRYEVIRVQTIKQAEIDKEKAIVKANQDKETEVIIKEQKKLIGEGDRLKAQEQAKGEAAPIREKGFAEAEAKEKLQAALNKFKDEAIRALVAEKIVAMQEVVGIETAKALTAADLRIFAGGDAGKQGFDLGQLVTSCGVANEGVMHSVLNKLARPNDLGFSKFELNDVKTQKEDKVLKSTKKSGKKD